MNFMSFFWKWGIRVGFIFNYWIILVKDINNGGSYNGRGYM